MDILDLEHACESLRAFLQQSVMPCARAAAVARFIRAVPSDVQGRAYYLDEIGPWLSEALRDDAYTCWDTEQARLIGAVVTELERAGVFSAGEAGELRRLAVQEPSRDARGVPRQRERDTGPDGSRPAPAAQVSVFVPLVCKLPPVPGQEGADEYVGMPAILTTALRAKHPKDDPITWNNGNALKATAGLRAFHDVAADLRVAARGAMHRLAGAGGGSGGSLGVHSGALRRIDLERLGFDLSIPEKQMPLAGDSIGLALAVAMAGAMTGGLKGGHGLRPRDDLAWTGTVLPSGEVLQVDRASLAAKIRVARAAGAAGIVVPHGMGTLARQIMRHLDWGGEVIEVSDLLEALGNRNLVRPWQLPGALARDLQRPVLGKALLTTASILGAIALVGFLPRILDEVSVHWYPLWRPFPPVSSLRLPAVTRPGFALALPGIRDIEVMPPEGRGIGFAQISDNLDGDLYRRPCLVCGYSQEFKGGHQGYVEVRDLRTDRIVRSRGIEGMGVPYEPRHHYPGAHYDVKAGVLADLDQDGRDEIVISASANPYAITGLSILDDDGHRQLVRTGSVLHQGHLEHLLTLDLDQDGRVEVVAAGYHGPSGGMSLLVLRGDDFYSPPEDSAEAVAARDRWTLDAQPCIAHLVAPMLPGYFEVSGITHLGGFQLGQREGASSGKLIRVEIGAGVSQAGDYLLNVPSDLDVEGVGIIVNQTFADQCQRWVSAGAKTDFSSEQFLERWRRLFRRTRTIQMGWDPGDGGLAAAARP